MNVTETLHRSEKAAAKMETASSCVNTTSRPRARVAGRGPDRKQLPLFKKLTELPEEHVVLLQKHFARFSHTNDLSSSENYQVSDHCPLKLAIPEGFQHLLLTHCPKGLDPRNEQNFTEWTPEARSTGFFHWFQNYFPRAFRIRLSWLASGTEFGWHIDTNTSVACRCSIPLSDANAVFEIRDKKRVAQVPMQRGDVFFTNTGWSHRVYNNDQEGRLNLVFGVYFEDIKRYFSKRGSSFE